MQERKTMKNMTSCPFMVAVGGHARCSGKEEARREQAT